MVAMQAKAKRRNHPPEGRDKGNAGQGPNANAAITVSPKRDIPEVVTRNTLAKTSGLLEVEAAENITAAVPIRERQPKGCKSERQWDPWAATRSPEENTKKLRYRRRRPKARRKALSSRKEKLHSATRYNERAADKRPTLGKRVQMALSSPKVRATRERRREREKRQTAAESVRER
jgi:hypothetical protein